MKQQYYFSYIDETGERKLVYTPSKYAAKRKRRWYLSRFQSVSEVKKSEK